MNNDYNVLLSHTQSCINELKDEDRQLLSDGCHSFDELYFHRMILFSVICRTYKSKAWKSRLHADGTMYEYYFIVGVDTKEGQFTYHYHMQYWGFFEDIKTLQKAPEWDGHTSKNISRLLSLKLED